jgi:hypothetical protein
MPHSFAVFMACWILLGIASWVFYNKAPYQTKKSAHPFIGIGTGIVFLGFVEWSSGGKVPWLFVIGVVVVIFLNIRNTQFCPECNATIYPRGFSRPSFCPKCGAKLEQD